MKCQEFKAIIKPMHKIPSVNVAYKPAHNGKRAWLYLDPEVGSYKEEVRELVQMSPLNEIKKITGIKKLKVLLIMYINKSSFWTRDSSNMVKNTEDAIAEAIGVDDRFTIMITSCKVPSPTAREAIGIRMRVYTEE